METFTIITRDSYGDSWGGGVLSLTDDDTGEVVATSNGPPNSCRYNLPDTCERTETFTLYCGSYSTSMFGGAYPEDRSWFIKDSSGSTAAHGYVLSSASFSTVVCASCGTAVDHYLGQNANPAQPGSTATLLGRDIASVVMQGLTGEQFDVCYERRGVTNLEKRSDESNTQNYVQLHHLSYLRRLLSSVWRRKGERGCRSDLRERLRALPREHL